MSRELVELPFVPWSLGTLVKAFSFSYARRRGRTLYAATWLYEGSLQGISPLNLYILHMCFINWKSEKYLLRKIEEY